MSERALDWASRISALTPGQREVLNTLAKHADDDGVVRGAYGLLKAHPGTITPRQAETALTALVQARTVAQQWNMDRYVWDVVLPVAK